ncbi:molecular chaperone DnaK [bacterium]|nr:molecular chaperone DnaK [bacterium]
MDSNNKIIGIDLGTTNSVAAIVLGNEPEVIPNSEGSNKTPSVVAFLESGDVVVGEIARRQAATNPLCTISSIKRLMGRSFEEVEESGELFPFQIVSHDSELLIDINGMGYRPEQISALVLKKMKEGAEEYLGEEIVRAVITVPAYFDDLQRQATIQAAEMAGLEVLRLINEPTAAAMAYGIGRSEDNDEIVAVYDFGGGTFDISLLEINGKTFEVLTSTGDSRLGGDDLDNAIVSVIVEEFIDEHGVDLTRDPVTLRRLKEVAERAKCELSGTTQTTMALPFIAYRDSQPLHLERMITRDEFEDLIEDFVRSTIRCCKHALDEANLKKNQISKVILVGGTTRIPLVMDAVEEFFDQQAFRGVNPDEVVALGAATQAGVFEGKVQEVTLLDVTPHSLGIEVEGEKFSRIIEKNSTIPIKAAKTFTTTEENQEFVIIHVLQGESDDAVECRSLGKFMLTGIPPASAGVPRIRVTFFINADGVMEISAEDMKTGQAEAITIVHTNLTEEERGRRSRRRQRRSRRGGRKAGGTGTSAKPRRGRIDKRRRSGVEEESRPSPEGAPLPASASSSGIRPPREPDPEDTFAPPQQFAVLGDTRPGERQGIGVRAHLSGDMNQSMSPVDYSKAPPMYTHAQESPEMRQSSPSGEVPIPTAPDSSRASTHHVPREESSTGNRRLDDTQLEAPPEQSFEDSMQIDIPEHVREAIGLAEDGVEDERAIHLYTQAIEALQGEPFTHIQTFAITRARALLNLMHGQMEGTREALATCREKHTGKYRQDVIDLHDRAVDRFGHVALLRDRGELHEQLGNLAKASADFEQAMRQAPSEGDVDVLRRLYNLRVEQENDPQAKFKLVKLLLKNNVVDEAIEILQDLQHHKNYETRAMKILGLCHWQKNMHYMAWQNFKQLPVDEDLRDILYRLAADLDASDQLQVAVAVLEHLNERTPGYRDVEARLRKLKYRLKLQQEEEDDSRGLPVLSKDSRFVILEEINRGSMGIIYKAKDKMLNEIVALKVLNDYLCSDPQAVERFKSEARAAKKLSHPYIVRIHDLFESDNKRFLSMEYIEGTDLKRILAERTSLTEEMILYYFLQICDALSYAHRLGIVHRDIKPANIMITNSNAVKITDFGIAKILRGEESTKSGTAVIGTPLYMAPEQIIGEPVDQRTDIYSLGIMLYETLSGNPPFYLGNIEYHHIHTAPPPLSERISKHLRDTIMRMISKRPEDRFQSIEELLPEVKAKG